MMRGARIVPALAAGLVLGAMPAGAGETDITAMTPAERAAFGRELRQALTAIPELPALARGRTPAVPDIGTIYADEIATDLSRIAARETALFGPERPGFGPADAAHRIALFTRSGCPACTRAEAGLRALAARHDLRVTLIDMDENAALARALDLDTAPSYVLPDMMLRGEIPGIVLERYLAR